VMKFLYSHGCNVHKKNAFGCNAVLWCAQGEGARLETLQWLKTIGCSMSLVNSNGHGALHKAAQRGRDDIVGWLVEELGDSIDFEWIGPDSDGYCPSDLAGVGGHVELARQLATVEIDLATRLIANVEDGSSQLPEWLRTKINGSQHPCRDDLWEPWAGVRRLQTLQLLLLNKPI
jgi:ankyrin repeat protein